MACEKGRPLEYALEGSVFVAGAVVRWLRDQMGVIKESKDSEDSALEVKDSAGVYFVPAFSGLGAPYWDIDARGTIVGLTAGITKNHIVRSALESIAYQTHDVINAMNADMTAFGGKKITSLKVDGGASANNLLMQMQSDVSGIDVVRLSCPEATAMGAAFLAGLAVGFYKDRNQIRKTTALGKTFTSSLTFDERKQKLDGWHKAINCAKAFSGEN